MYFTSIRFLCEKVNPFTDDMDASNNNGDSIQILVFKNWTTGYDDDQQPIPKFALNFVRNTVCFAF